MMKRKHDYSSQVIGDVIGNVWLSFLFYLFPFALKNLPLHLVWPISSAKTEGAPEIIEQVGLALDVRQ